jgi:hypothetical protein
MKRRKEGKVGRIAECTAPPAPLAGFPGIPYEYVEMLKARGISTTSHFLQITGSDMQSSLLSRSTGIPENRIMEIRVLCDLARIMGLKPIVARGIYSAGIRSVIQLAEENSHTLGKKIGEGSGANDPDSGVSMNEIETYIQCARILAESDRKQQR